MVFLGSRMLLRRGSLGFENKIYLQDFLSRITWLKCLKFVMWYVAWTSGLPRFLFLQMVAPGTKMTPPHEVLGLNHTNT